MHGSLWLSAFCGGVFGSPFRSICLVVTFVLGQAWSEASSDHNLVTHNTFLLHSRMLAHGRSQCFPADGTVTGHPQLGKNFEPASEEALYKWWESQGFFSPEARPSGEPYAMCMPPPNVTGRLHMGHAMFVALQDIIARYQRLRGRAVLWVPGTDHAGIATQMVVERAISDEGTSRQELGRSAFEERVWQWKEAYGGAISQQLRRLGASCDWGREAFTLDEGLSSALCLVYGGHVS
jgi:hypothetical protein